MIKVNSPKIIKVNFGNVLKIIDNKSPGYSRFGEAYFSFINYNKIKGWKKHTKMKMNLVVPFGKVQFVFYNHINQKFKKVTIGETNYKRITVEPGIWFAFKGLSKKKNIILNISNIKHSPNESESIELKSIYYNWGS